MSAILLIGNRQAKTPSTYYKKKTNEARIFFLSLVTYKPDKWRLVLAFDQKMLGTVDGCRRRQSTRLLLN